MNKCDAQICVSIDALGRSVRDIVAYQQTAGCASKGEPSSTSAAPESTEAMRNGRCVLAIINHYFVCVRSETEDTFEHFEHKNK